MIVVHRVDLEETSVLDHAHVVLPSPASLKLPTLQWRYQAFGGPLSRLAVSNDSPPTRRGALLMLTQEEDVEIHALRKQ